MMSQEERERGVIACSAGSHAQGAALASTKHGIKLLICLSDTAPVSKAEATKIFGAEACLVGSCYDGAYQKALEVKESKGYTFVHPFDEENVIAGQGSVALEILNELGDIGATSLSRVIDRGLLNFGRSSGLLIELIDKPGRLKDISGIIADCGGNVTGVHCENGNIESVNGCFLRIEIEKRDYDHVNLITQSLRNEGFKII